MTPNDRKLRIPVMVYAIVVFACVLVAMATMVYLVCVYADVPQTVGYHFAADGNFDLFGDKSIAFWHPIVAEWLLLIVFGVFGFIAFRLNPSKRLRLSEHRISCCAVAFTCAFFLCETVALFAHWICCVVAQNPLCVDVIFVFVCVTIALFVALFVSIAILYILGRIASKKEPQEHCDR